MFQRIKSLYYKEGYEDGCEDPFEYHWVFILILKVFYMDDSNKIAIWAYIGGFISFAFVVFGIPITSLAFDHGIKNYSTDLGFTVISGAFLIYYYYIAIVTYTLLRSKNHFIGFQNILRKDFLFITGEKGKIYRKRYFQEQLDIWQLILISAVVIGTSYTILVISCAGQYYYFEIVHGEDTEKQKPTFFPMHFPGIDFTKYPYYEFSAIYFVLSTGAFGYIYIFKVQAQIVWIKQIIVKANLVIWQIEDLLADVQPVYDTEKDAQLRNIVQTRLKLIVKTHQSMFDLIDHYAGVYKKMIMLEQKIVDYLMCMCTYVIVERRKNGEFHGVLIVMDYATVLMAYVTCHYTTLLEHKVESICDACWSTPFWNAKSFVRPYLVIIMQRSLRILPLVAPGFDQVNLQLFSSKMASAYSMYNMLRQIEL